MIGEGRIKELVEECTQPFIAEMKGFADGIDAVCERLDRLIEIAEQDRRPVMIVNTEMKSLSPDELKAFRDDLEKALKKRA